MPEAIKVSLGREGERVFDSWDDLLKWITKERTFWATLSQGAYDFPDAQGVWSSISETLGELLAKTNTAKGAQPEYQQQQLLNLENQFRNVFEKRNFLTSTSPEASFLQQLKETEGVAVLSYAMAFFIRFGITYQGEEAIRGALNAFCFESGLKNREQNDTVALRTLRKEWQGIYQTLKEEQKSLLVEHKAIHAQNQTAFENQRGDVTAFFEGIKKQWGDLIKVYEEKLALSAPVLYWQQKAGQHLGGIWLYGVGSLLLVGGSAFSLIKFAVPILTPPSGLREPEKWHPAYWELASLLIVAAALIWGLRILVKLFLSNVHLRSDAQERVVMVQTYLALLRGKKVSEEERKLVLVSIFRPAATGVVKDDGMPLPSLEALTRVPARD